MGVEENQGEVAILFIRWLYVPAQEVDGTFLFRFRRAENLRV